MRHYLSPGDQLDQYEIRERIGRGGMGVVYKAYEEKLDRLVAIKMLLVEYAENEKFIRDFRREARIIANWDNPNIVKIYNLGQFEGQDYLAMQFIEGESLEDRLRRKIVSFQELSDIVSQVARALTYAHERGVIHRDIKPSNILIDEKENRVYVVDFGLGRVAQPGEIYQTRGGGTPAFMAPEQFHGKVSQATDIYGLGITVYRVLTGDLPHEGSSEYELGRNKNERPPKPPSKLNPEITSELEKVILRAIATKPQNRYRTVWELAEAFTQAVRQVGAGRLTVPEVESKPSRSSQNRRLGAKSAPKLPAANARRLIWVIGSISLLVLAAIVLIPVLQNSTPTVTKTAPPTPIHAQQVFTTIPGEMPTETAIDITEEMAGESPLTAMPSITPTATVMINPTATPQHDPGVFDAEEQISSAIMSDEGEVNCPMFNESYEFLRGLFESATEVPEIYADWRDPVTDRKSYMNKIYKECKDSDDDNQYVGSDLLNAFMFEEFPSD